MEILNIAVKEIKCIFRNKKILVMDIIFPLILIFVLGTVLSGALNKSPDIKDVNVGYTISSSGDLGTSFSKFVDSGNKLHMKFLKFKSYEQGIKAVENKDCEIFVEVKDSKILLYKNNSYDFEGSLVESVIRAFAQRYNAVASIADINPRALSGLDNDIASINLVKNTSLQGKREPCSMDYYAVSMLTLILMYSALTGLYSILDEVKTMDRVFCSPVNKNVILAGKLIGYMLFSAVQIMFLIVFSKYVFNAYWGAHIGIILLIALAESIMTMSFGMAMAFLIKDHNSSRSIVNLVIVVMGFLGGAYFPIDNIGKALQQVSSISPIKWINNSIFQIIYSNDYSMAGVSIVISLAAAAVFVFITSFSYRREGSLT